jgi:hypothetical protein
VSLTQRGCVLLAAGLLAALVAPAELPRAFGRAIPPDAGASARLAKALPRFALFGWVSPPLESTTVARYAELAGAGFNTAVLAWEDSGRVADNLARIAASDGTGLHLLLFDRDLARFPVGTPGWFTMLDSVTQRYRTAPGFLGYYLGDEPTQAEFRDLGRFASELRARDPEHPPWNNLLGLGAFASRADFERYVRSYVATVRPAVLCDDQYDFLVTGDRLQLTENIATLGSIARENGLPFWGIIQLVRHAMFRDVTEGLLRWQVAQWLAYGARGIGYFTYWTPAPNPAMNWQPAMIEWGSGNRTPFYDMVRQLNQRVAPMGDTLATMQWLGVAHAGSVPPGGTPFSPGGLLAGAEGRATIGYFSDAAAAPLLFVANADSLAPAVVTLAPAGGRTAARLSDDGTSWTPLAAGAGGRVALALAAGDFALLRLSGRVDSLVVGRAPRLAASPNPGRGSVVFSAHGLSGPARLDLFDLGGRRIWSRAFSGTTATAVWHGERDGGGRVGAGAVFARLEDGNGAAVRRVMWLGAP